MVDLKPLGDASLIKGLDADHVALMGASAREFHYRAGEYLFRLGDHTDTIFIVRDGLIDLTIPLMILGVEKEVVIEELAPGDTLAWSTLVRPFKLTMSARAKSSADLVGFSREQLKELFKTHPDLGCVVMTNLTEVISHRLDLTKAMWFAELQRSVDGKYG